MITRQIGGEIYHQIAERTSKQDKQTCRYINRLKIDNDNDKHVNGKEERERKKERSTNR